MDSRSIAASSGWISGQVDIRRLTIITSGMALIRGCIPPSSKSIHPLNITTFSLSGHASQVMAHTELQIGSLGNADTGVTVAFSSDSRAWALPLGINSASPLLRVNTAPLSMLSTAEPWLTK
ncbi:hypothetical protein D3C71_1708140 [compost metagenome]